MDLSIVIPLLNEEESLPELTDWIRRVVTENGYSTEIIFVDDGSTDNSWNIIEELAAKYDDIKVRGIKFGRNYGKSAGLYYGFEAAEGEVVFTMDADLQDSPDEIPIMYKMLIEEGYDILSGYKQKRYDPLNKTLPSKLFNGTARIVSGIKLHDFNCGLKAYRKKVVKSIELFGEMHRYIPILAKNAGFKKIGEKVVQHQARKYGVSKFGMERYLKGFLDLLTISFIGRFGKRPMHFFGLFGSLSFLIGFISTIYLGAHKLYMVSIGKRAQLLAENPIFFIALVAMIIGGQLFLSGFIAELLLRNSSERNAYLIDKRIND